MMGIAQMFVDVEFGWIVFCGLVWLIKNVLLKRESEQDLLWALLAVAVGVLIVIVFLVVAIGRALMSG